MTIAKRLIILLTVPLVALLANTAARLVADFT
jgi:hypothetical protein